MRKLLITAAIAVMASASPAFAADTGTTEINASLAPTCSIVSQSSSITLAAAGVAVPGNFSYKCNFIGAPALNFVSANQGVHTEENGKSTNTYAIYLNDAPPSVPISAWLKSSATPQAYPSSNAITTSTAPNVVRTPTFQVALVDALTVAGTYTDTLTISINP